MHDEGPHILVESSQISRATAVKYKRIVMEKERALEEAYLPSSFYSSRCLEMRLYMISKSESRPFLPLRLRLEMRLYMICRSESRPFLGLRLKKK